MKILLVGVACVGKTAIGQRLAERLGFPFFDLDEEVERFYGTSIERLQQRWHTMEEFRKKCALVLTYVTTRKCGDDFVIALPPRGLMGPYLRAVRQLDGVTVVALKDKAENILSRVVFYDIDSNPLEKHLTRAEERLYLKEIKADLAYFGRSYKKADLAVELSETHGIEEAAARVERALRARMQSPGSSQIQSTGKGVEMMNQAGPIAQELIKEFRAFKRQGVFDFEQLRAGQRTAEELEKTIASSEELAKLHPAHAVYAYAQNQASVLSEQLTQLPVMSAFVDFVGKAEDEYLPSGPPMSPLTTSYFTCWALFDAFVGESRETIGTCMVAVASEIGLDEDLLRLVKAMQESRMGFYTLEGFEADCTVLREVVTGVERRAIVPSGHRGNKGELWFLRVLPPPLPGSSSHVVFTTPYVILWPGPTRVGCVLREDGAEGRLRRPTASLRVPDEVRTRAELLERVRVRGVRKPPDRGGVSRRASRR